MRSEEGDIFMSGTCQRVHRGPSHSFMHFTRLKSPFKFADVSCGSFGIAAITTEGIATLLSFGDEDPTADDRMRVSSS